MLVQKSGFADVLYLEITSIQLHNFSFQYLGVLTQICTAPDVEVHLYPNFCLYCGEANFGECKVILLIFFPVRSGFSFGGI